MSTFRVQENVQKYYGSRLEISEDLQTNAACMLPSRPMSKMAFDALKLVHPEVCKRYFGCGLVVPEKLQDCKVLDLGSGSGRDCYILSKLIGQKGYVIGLDMTQEMILLSREYIKYHQEKFGYEKPNTIFVQGYMERLAEAGIQNDSVDVVVSNCVVCLCADKKAVLREAHRVLKEGGELYFSDMYASKVVPDNLKEDPILWGEGMGGSLFWKDLISLAQEVGFSKPLLVTASHIVVYNEELLRKAGDVRYASGTYRLFKLPKDSIQTPARVTYKGTVPGYPDQLVFHASHSFKEGEVVRVDAEMAAILRCSRFSSHFSVQMSDHPEDRHHADPQGCHLSPFWLADQLGSSMKQCSKTGKAGGDDGSPPSGC